MTEHQRRRLSKDAHQRTSLDAGAWWTMQQTPVGPTSQPMFSRSMSAPVTQDNYYSWSLGPATVATHAPLERQTSAHDSGYHDSMSDHATSSSHEKTPFKQPGSTINVATHEKMQDQVKERELQAVQEAVRRSRIDDAREQQQREQEELMLQAAIAESARIAEMADSSAEREQAQLASAILESRRQNLQQQQQPQASSSLLSPPPLPPPPPPLKSVSQSDIATNSHEPSLEELEHLIQSRNEKGSIWREAGAHGWLPPGASFSTSADEARELAMLETAIKASLEEERARTNVERRCDSTRSRPVSHISMNAPLPPPDIFDSSSEMYRSTIEPASWTTDRRLTHTSLLPIVTSHASGPISPPTSPDLMREAHSSDTRHDKNRETSGGPPSYAESNLASPSHLKFPTTSGSVTAPQSPLTLSPPTSPVLGGDRLLSPRPLSVSDSPSPWDSARGIASGSPFDLPFLMSSTSLHSTAASRDQHAYTSSTEQEVSNSLLGSSLTRINSKSATPLRASVHSEDFESSHDDELVRTQSSLSLRGTESLTIRNPDSGIDNVPALIIENEDDGVSASRQPELQNRQSLLEPVYTGPNRTLSLVSEKTEPPSPTSKNSMVTEDVDTGNGGIRLDAEVASIGDVGQLTQDIDSVTVSNNSELVSESVDYIEHGVRFGFIEKVKVEHDGHKLEGELDKEPPFPRDIRLSSGTSSGTTVDEPVSKPGSVIEAASWTQLLRFLMWYGDSTVRAASIDVNSAHPGRCEASLSLSFDKNIAGDHIIRLTTALSASSALNAFNEPPELKMIDGNSASFQQSISGDQGKGKARATSSTAARAVFVLPDRIVLPARLSQIAISLHSLRHVAQIALSTQPAEYATEEFYALRTLAVRIKALGVVNSITVAASEMTTTPTNSGSQAGDGTHETDANPNEASHELDPPNARLPTSQTDELSLDHQPMKMSARPQANMDKTNSNVDLVERIKARLRRFKSASNSNESSSPSSALTSPSMSHARLGPSLSSAGYMQSGRSSLPRSSASSAMSSIEAYDGSDFVHAGTQHPNQRLRKPARTTVVRRKDRILLQDDDEEELETQAGVDGDNEYETLVEDEEAKTNSSSFHGTRNTSRRTSSVSLN
ncbi:hypothetical protein OIO90_000444 [Microbotryomycetes sp. JL221]|nr:hypothetical protein OIO90_000444 [Microbotryomycetes sp. JL221]